MLIIKAASSTPFIIYVSMIKSALSVWTVSLPWPLSTAITVLAALVAD